MIVDELPDGFPRGIGQDERKPPGNIRAVGRAMRRGGRSVRPAGANALGRSAPVVCAIFGLTVLVPSEIFITVFQTFE
jgi:hypothetical protein